jgi:hypothetical protein
MENLAQGAEKKELTHSTQKRGGTAAPGGGEEQPVRSGVRVGKEERLGFPFDVK